MLDGSVLVCSQEMYKEILIFLLKECNFSVRNSIRLVYCRTSLTYCVNHHLESFCWRNPIGLWVQIGGLLNIMKELEESFPTRYFNHRFGITPSWKLEFGTTVSGIVGNIKIYNKLNGFFSLTSILRSLRFFFSRFWCLRK